MDRKKKPNGIRTKGLYMCDSAFLSAKFVKGFSSTGNGLEVGGSNSKNSSAGIRPTTQPTISFPSAIRESSRIGPRSESLCGLHVNCEG